MKDYMKKTAKNRENKLKDSFNRYYMNTIHKGETRIMSTNTQKRTEHRKVKWNY